MRRILTAALAALMLGALAVSGPAAAAPPPEGTEWSEHYFPSDDGITMLHADVLRPEGLSNKDKTPVILTVSPYTNHSGQTTDFNPNAEGPSERFYDFLEVSDIIERGYTYVIVDLPGTGGSGGCNDWGGVREQGAAKAAVEWAASRPWSTGRVGMIGKSYDGWTGLMAMAQKPKGLAAVVSMEPVYSGYRYLYNNAVRFSNSLLTPASFQAIDAKPGSVNDDPQYLANGSPQAWCYGVNYGLQQQDDENSDFWRERNLLPPTKGVKTPLFLTQGFLETNTKADAAFDFFNRLGGNKNRAWFGQFDHYRGWEKDGNDYLFGRGAFVAEMVRFFDRHVKGVPARKAPTHRDPVVEVQDNFGRYRAEKQWPPRDSKLFWTDLRTGAYADNGRRSSTGSSATQGLWSVSPKLSHDVWLAGEPKVRLKVNTVPRANVAVNLYDIAPDGKAVVVSRGTSLVQGLQDQALNFKLYGQDWLIKKGHRLGVAVSSSNTDWWLHVPTNAEVTVADARIGLPFLKFNRTEFLAGKATSTLKSWVGSETTDVSQDFAKTNAKNFRLPKPLRSR